MSRCIAEQRLQSLERKFDKNSTFKKDYITFMDDMIPNMLIVPDDHLLDSEGQV